MNQKEHKAASLDPRDLLAHADWVSHLAIRLVGRSDADDFVQQTWIRALESPPRHLESLKGWLAQILRNEVRGHKRSEARRKAKEELVAGPDVVGSTADVVEKAKTQRRVVDCVLKLDEPYRSAILLRFFENLPPRDMARTLGVPVNTARTHLRRGLAKLREELDEDYGDRGSWTAALLPLVRWGERPSGPSLKTLVALPLAMIGVVCVLLFVKKGSDPEGALSRPGNRAQATLNEKQEVEQKPTDASRMALEASASDAALPIESSAETPRTRLPATLVGVDAQPIHGVRLRIRENAEFETIETDSRGRFEIAKDVLGQPDRVSLVDRDLTLLGGCLIQESPSRLQDDPYRILFVVAPTRDLSGRLIGPNNEPVEAARLRVMWSLESLLEFPYSLRVIHYLEPPTHRSTEEGEFSIRRVPNIHALRLRISHLSYQRQDHWISPERSEPLEIALKRAIPERRFTVSGSILNAQGIPLKAWIAYGKKVAQTDDEGHYRLESMALRENSALYVWAQGWQPQSFARAGEEALSQPMAWRDRRIILDRKCRAISGKVIAENPSRLRLEVVNPSLIDTSFQSLERRCAGRRGPVIPADDGSFLLDGLSDRDYTLRLWREGSQEMLITQSLPAGATVEIPFSPPMTELLGRVIDRSGAAIDGASVRPGFPTFVGKSGGSLGEWGDPITVSASGEFRISSVSQQGRIEISGPGLIPQVFEVLDSGSTYVVARRALFRIHDPTIQSFQVLDSNQRLLPVEIQFPLETRVTQEVTQELVGSPGFGFPKCEVDDSATWIRIRTPEVSRLVPFPNAVSQSPSVTRLR